MDHVEVADLGEKSPHGFSVVLAVSDGSGPAHKIDFIRKRERLTGLRTDVHIIIEATALASLSCGYPARPLTRGDTASYTSGSYYGQVRVRKRLFGESSKSVSSSSRAKKTAPPHPKKKITCSNQNLLVEAQMSFFCCNSKEMFDL